MSKIYRCVFCSHLIHDGGEPYHQPCRRPAGSDLKSTEFVEFVPDREPMTPGLFLAIVGVMLVCLVVIALACTMGFSFLGMLAGFVVRAFRWAAGHG